MEPPSALATQPREHDAHPRVLAEGGDRGVHQRPRGVGGVARQLQDLLGEGGIEEREQPVALVGLETGDERRCPSRLETLEQTTCGSLAARGEDRSGLVGAQPLEHVGGARGGLGGEQLRRLRRRGLVDRVRGLFGKELDVAAQERERRARCRFRLHPSSSSRPSRRASPVNRPLSPSQ